MAAKKPVNWRKKLEKEQERRLVHDPRRGGTMLIPCPLDVDGLVRQVERGSLATVDQIRDRLARNHGAQLTCPLCTGIFWRIVAEAAEEDRAAGREPIAPWWRVLKGDGSLNEKLPGGAARQAELLRAEGHTLTPPRGKRPPRVEGFKALLLPW